MTDQEWNNLQRLSPERQRQVLEKTFKTADRENLRAFATKIVIAIIAVPPGLGLIAYWVSWGWRQGAM
jgi:hypothetical protein